MITVAIADNWPVKRNLWTIASLMLSGVASAVLARLLSEDPAFGTLLWTISLCLIALASAWCVGTLLSFINNRTKSVAKVLAEKARSNLDSQIGLMRSISDDVRAPLIEIVSGIHQMMQHPSSPESRRDLLAIYTQATKLQSRLNSTLELGRTQTKSASTDKSIDITQITSDIAENYSQLLFDRPELLVSILADQNLPKLVSVDPRRVMLLIGNLLENAFENTESGQVVVRISAQNTAVKVGKNIELDIVCSDNGRGIDSTKLSRISEELSACSNNTNSFREIGLGLRSAMSIVSDYRGSLSISSKEGQGTIAHATLKLPVIQLNDQQLELPKVFRFAGTSVDMQETLANAAEFHGISMIVVENPLSLRVRENIVVDGSDLMRSKWGDLKSFQPRNHYVVMLRKDQQLLREYLVSQGFSRFLSLPLVSTTLIQFLTNQDVPLIIKQSANKDRDISTKTALVVDDAETNRLRICYHLRENGFKITEASDGLEMVALMKSGKRFDLVISDLNMTHLNGEEAVRIIRDYEQDHNYHTPIVAVSAYSNPGDEVAIKAAGFDAALKKPVFLDELDYLISQLTKNEIKIAEQIETTSIRENVMAETNFIDLEDLRKRSAGKTRLMALLLDSYIQASATHLETLKSTPTDGDQAACVRSLHTLKGLLLEAGAVSCAEKLKTIEEHAKQSGSISSDDLQDVSKMVESVASEAAEIRSSLV
jgi:CheY-like chemotaxis protein